MSIRSSFVVPLALGLTFVTRTGRTDAEKAADFDSFIAGAGMYTFDGRPHGRGLRVGLRQQAAAQQAHDLD